jgi:hypothetical protein
MSPVHRQPAAVERMWNALHGADRVNLHLASLEDRARRTRQVVQDLRGQLATLTGSDGGHHDHVLAYADGGFARVLLALDGETDPARLRFAGPMPLPPRPDPTPATPPENKDQLPLPEMGGAA